MTDRLAYFTSSLLLEKEREKKKAQICFIKFASSNEVPLPLFSSFFFFFFFEIYSTPDDTKNIAPE